MVDIPAGFNCTAVGGAAVSSLFLFLNLY